MPHSTTCPEPLDESKLMGNELALMISRLKIENDSPIPKTVSYYIKPWKPTSGQLDYGAMPAQRKERLGNLVARELCLRHGWRQRVRGLLCGLARSRIPIVGNGNKRREVLPGAEPR